MALFSVKPAIVQKDVAATFTIDYAELATYSAVPAGYYKTTTNWEKVFVRLKHKYSNQKAMLEFTLPNTSADLLLTDAARAGDWELEHLMIRDYDKGEVLLQRSDIPSVGDIDFIARSAATHGDVYVAAGQDVTIPSGGKRQYGDFVVEAGGILRLADGGGITEIEVLETCLINGTIFANNGKHSGGTWNSISVLGENLSHTVTQKAGGAGGEGEAKDLDLIGESFDVNLGVFTKFAGTDDVSIVGGKARSTYITGGQDPITGALITTIPGQTYTVTTTVDKISGSGIANLTVTAKDGNAISNGYTDWGFASTLNTQALTVSGTINFTFVAASSQTSIAFQHGADFGTFDLDNFFVSGPSAGGAGGAATSGNGGGGGRSAQFGALAGGNASVSLAGLGAGQDNPAADEYGEDGADTLTASEAANGGFRGAHGQALYLKARKIQGTGTINASGQKGGDGGDGAEYNSGGILYGNGAGGGGAGGDAGNVWVRYQLGTPALNINVDGGAQGSRGFGGFGSTEAEHGTVGSDGTVDIATFS